LTSKVIKAGKIVLIGSFISRGISALSSIILARLLFENDYGALVIATIFTGLISQIGGMGYEIYYLQYKGSEEEKAKVLDQVFNLRLVTNAIMFIIQIIIGFGLILLTDDKMSGGIILIMSFSLLLEGFNAPNEVILKNRMDFRKITIGNILKEFFSTIGKVGGALIGIGGYCFGIGPVLGSLTRMIYLLKVQKYRPERFNWNKLIIKRVFDFGKQVLFGSLAMYLVKQIDRILLSSFYPKNVVGQYGFASNISSAPFNYLVSPQQALVMTFIATYNRKKSQLLENLMMMERLISLFFIPFSAFILIFSNEFIVLLFSDRWLSVLPIFRLLVLYYAIQSITFPFSGVLTGIGMPHINTKLVIWRVVFLLPALILVSLLFRNDIMNYVLVFCIISALFDIIKVVISISKINEDCNISLRNFRFEVISLLMILCIYLTNFDQNSIYVKIISTACFLIFYLTSIFVIDFVRTKNSVTILGKAIIERSIKKST